MSDTANKSGVINFGAGPAKLRQEVLNDAQKGLLSYRDTKLSILEISHRSNDFKTLIEDAQVSVRDLLNIPYNYKILFIQGGATGLFAAVPLNLLNSSGSADYIVTGHWSATAAKEAAKYAKVNLVLPKQNYTDIPNYSTWNLETKASYVYYCANETIHGVKFHYVSETNGVTLVVDMSSNILTKQLDVTKFAVIFAGAQKNIGPAGVTLVIVRDVLGRAMPICPSILDFSIVARDNSIHNTPPVFQIYVVGQVFDWIKKNGGVEGMEELAHRKSKKVYETIDESNGFYVCPVKRDVCSRMNVPFRIGNNNEEFEKQFLAGSVARGMLQLKGHRSVGGIRASLYNAVTEEDVEALVNYMKWFQNMHQI